MQRPFNKGEKMAIIYGCKDNEYWKIDAINSSALKCFLNNQIEYKNRYILKALEFKKTDAMDFGSALHCKILEPHEFNNRCIIKPADINLTTKEGKEWKAGACGKIIISEKQEQLINVLYTRINSITSNCIPEVWSDEQYTELVVTSLHNKNPLKCKVDWLIVGEDRVINIDLKTTTKLDDRALMYSIRDYGYDVQGAFYHYIISNNYDKPVDTYYIFLSKETGDARIINMNNFVVNAMAKVLKGIDDLVYAKENNIYSSPYDSVDIIEIPDWF